MSPAPLPAPGKKQLGETGRGQAVGPSPTQGEAGRQVRQLEAAGGRQALQPEGGSRGILTTHLFPLSCIKHAQPTEGSLPDTQLGWGESKARGVGHSFLMRPLRNALASPARAMSEALGSSGIGAAQHKNATNSLLWGQN